MIGLENVPVDTRGHRQLIGEDREDAVPRSLEGLARTRSRHRPDPGAARPREAPQPEDSVMTEPEKVVARLDAYTQAERDERLAAARLRIKERREELQERARAAAARMRHP